MSIDRVVPAGPVVAEAVSGPEAVERLERPDAVRAAEGVLQTPGVEQASLSLADEVVRATKSLERVLGREQLELLRASLMDELAFDPVLSSLAARAGA